MIINQKPQRSNQMSCERCKDKGTIQGEYAKTASGYASKVDWDSTPTKIWVSNCPDCTEKENDDGE